MRSGCRRPAASTTAFASLVPATRSFSSAIRICSGRKMASVDRAIFVNTVLTQFFRRVTDEQCRKHCATSLGKPSGPIRKMPEGDGRDVLRRNRPGAVHLDGYALAKQLY